MRTFVAAEISNEDLLNSIAKMQADFKIKATPVNKQNMHFTLLFLGEITDDMAEKVKKALGPISFNPIEARFSHVGSFPNPRSPRVIWLGIDETASKELVELASQVEERLAPLGFKADKPFKPHLTIFRIKQKVDDPSFRTGKEDLSSHKTRGRKNEDTFRFFAKSSKRRGLKVYPSCFC